VKPTHPYYFAVAVWCVVFFAIVPSMSAQEATASSHIGVPQDWSQNNILFSRDTLALHPNLMDREPRVLHQAMQRWQPPISGVFHAADLMPTVAAKSGLHRDWNVSLLGGRLSQFRFPAKFSFNPAAAPDCTNDYVVFGLNTASTGTQANLVAFNNLYSGTGPPAGLCGAAPTVLFGYDTTTVTGGKIVTSPILSLDGKKIGFVESVPANAGLGITASAIFHVLTWTAGQGTIGAAVLPSAMTSLPFSLTHNDSASSPYIDYGTDTAYVGSDNGQVYKITGVFNGIPALSLSPWPVQAGTFHVTSPVLDSVLGKLMVGSSNGNLYQIDTTSGVATPLSVGSGTSAGIVAPPIVDITNGTTFVVSANDTTSAVLVQADTVSNTLLAKGRIGLGAAGGATINMHLPALSNNYYNDPSTGLIRLCGTGPINTIPFQYAFGFTGHLMHTTPSFSQQIPTNPIDSTVAQCTGWTEFFNPNVAGGTDFFFFGLTKDCTASGGAGGCVAEITDADPTTLVTTTVSGGPSGIVTDNYSTAAQASSIYLTAGGINTAYKFTQSGLQ